MEKQIGRNPQITVAGKNQNGVLLAINKDDSYKKEAKNIIYINGSQLGHYNRKGALDNGFTSRTKWMRHWAFGSDCDWYDEYHRPYIFKYIVENKRDDMFRFAASLLHLLYYLESDQNILVGKSYGGLISTIASDSSLIQKNILVHPDLLGSPLSNIQFLKDYKKAIQMHSLSGIQDALMIQIAYNNIMAAYAFTEDTANGLPSFIPNEKMVVYGGSVEKNSEVRNFSDFMQKRCSETIQRMTGKTNDGISIFEKQHYIDKNIPVVLLQNTPYHSNTQDPKVMKYIFHHEISK